MASRIHRFPMPEGGAERGIFYAVHHRCSQGNALRAHIPDCDQVEFAIGFAGMDVPAFTPFDVQSVDPCEACGMYLKLWAEWVAPLIIP